MARPKTITDAQIERAARAVFIEYGPQAPVSQIAERLGVSHAALFNRAGSKQELMLRALQPKHPEALERLSGPIPDGGVHEHLIAILSELMVFLHHLVPCLVVLRAAGMGPQAMPEVEGPPPPVALRRGLASWLARARREGVVAALDPQAAAEGVFGAMEARCFNTYLSEGAQESFAPGSDADFLYTLIEGLIPLPNDMRRR